MMTQMLLLLHNLICHFAPLGQASHVVAFWGAIGGPQGVSETSAVTSHGCWTSCPQGPPTSSLGWDKPEKTSAWALLYLRDSQGEDSLICIGFGRLQVVTITTNWASVMCWVLSWHSAWVILLHSTQSFKTWVTVLSVRSGKRDTGDKKKSLHNFRSARHRALPTDEAPRTSLCSHHHKDLSGKTFPRSCRS